MHAQIADCYYRYGFENSLDAILLTQPNGSIIRANPAACFMFGKTEEEICRHGRNGIVDIHDPRLVPALNERNIKGEIRTELNFVRSNGEVFPAYLSSKIFIDELGESWSIIIIKDLSFEKHIQIMIDKLQEDTLYLANHDYLTETYNRRGFMTVFQTELTRCAREKIQCGLALIDIDYFKVVNDLYGHLTGDLILKHVVSIFKECLRPYDTIGRFGGDEFIICLPHLSSETARLIGERLRKSIEEHPYVFEGQTIKLSVSVGLKLINHESVAKNDINGLIKEVDNLMYLAKKRRNSINLSD